MPSREPELYKDKIEVSLDGRQIFYLFFGGAVIVGLVFVLGVMVGRRVEARGHLDRADTSAARDPLAALDRLERSDNLSYHGALTGAQAPTDVEKAIGELEKRRAGGEAKTDAPRSEPVARPDKPDADKHADKRDDKHAADKRDSDKRDPDKRDADKRDPDKRDPDKSDDKKSRKHDDARPDRDKKASHGDAVTHPDARTDARPADAHADKPATDGADAGKAERSAEARTRFTLQLSSFQDRSEAEAFLGSIKSAGFQPYLTEADVTGKGTFYRVRLGSYRSLEAANDAKAEYEKTSKKTAQVMHL
jgi:DedD protein